MSDLGVYAKQILDSFKKKITEYFDGISGERNVLYLEKLIDVTISPAQRIEYGIGIPLEKGRKVDFAMASIEYEMPLVAILRFKDFPLKEILIRFDFPSVLFGIKGAYPKITFTTTLNMSWPGDFGLVWMPITGSEKKFAFHPYENRENKLDDLINFYTEGIVDPLCDYINSSQHKLAVKIRNNLKKFIETNGIEVWNYQNPFSKKKEYNIIETPIYCNYFEENDASILYFECYALKKAWVPPADIIVEILQYIGLATEMFDYDGNLIQDPDKLAEIEAQVEALHEHTQKLERKKRAAELKEEWDPFKPVKQVKRDSLGFAVGETVMKEEHESVLSQVEKMKNLMSKSLSLQEETPVPVEWTPTPKPETPAPSEPELPTSIESTPAIPPTAPAPTAPAPTAPAPTAPAPTAPAPTASAPTAPAPTAPAPTAPAPTAPAPTAPAPTAPAPTAPAPTAPALQTQAESKNLWQQPSPDPTPDFEWDDTPKGIPETASPHPPAPTQSTQVQPRLRGQSRPTASQPATQEIASKPQYWANLKKKTPAPASTPASTPTSQSFAYAKDWFAEFQMRQFVTVGNGSDLEFKYRGDFKLIASMPKPFMLTFARDTLRTKKMITSAEVIEILFRFFKSGHIKAV
ncbi:MAG: hypothetical protein ACTSR8_00735 [Promethearchaeota archaeon]